MGIRSYYVSSGNKANATDYLGKLCAIEAMSFVCGN
jgi:hypothetical protein